jgi:hypothetical protein
MDREVRREKLDYALRRNRGAKIKGKIIDIFSSCFDVRAENLSFLTLEDTDVFIKTISGEKYEQTDFSHSEATEFFVTLKNKLDKIPRDSNLIVGYDGCLDCGLLRMRANKVVVGILLYLFSSEMNYISLYSEDGKIALRVRIYTGTLDHWYNNDVAILSLASLGI